MLKIGTFEKRILSVKKDKARLDKARLNYVEWVNHVMALHKSPNIEEFRVFFGLTNSYKSSIDEWLRFALARKVERLELNLIAEAFRSGLMDCYTFDPYSLLKRKFDHVRYLKRIFLSHVIVNDKALTFFITRCPLLEHLSVSESQGLSRLKIIRPFPSFKRLEINLCHSLRSVKIRDANLVYFKYRGHRVHFDVQNLPLLVEMYIGGMGWDVRNVLQLFSNYIPQLEILVLDILGRCNLIIIQHLCWHVKMINLKQLRVKAWIAHDDPLMLLTSLVHASPCLQRFVLEAKWRERPRFIKRKARKIERSYPQLKEIEFVGYRGVVCELELFTHFLDNAVALEKIRVDTRNPRGWRYLDKIYFASKVNEIAISAKSRAKKQLPRKVPPTINLEIL